MSTCLPVIMSWLKEKKYLKKYSVGQNLLNSWNKLDQVSNKFLIAYMSCVYYMKEYIYWIDDFEYNRTLKLFFL